MIAVTSPVGAVTQKKLVLFSIQSNVSQRGRCGNYERIYILLQD